MLKTSKQLLVLVAISENPAVINWGCQQIKVVMYNGCKTVA